MTWFVSVIRVRTATVTSHDQRFLGFSTWDLEFKPLGLRKKKNSSCPKDLRNYILLSKANSHFMVKLKVNEIFYSIQGESTYTGMPCVFIRLSGCNLRCTFCDTRYAYDEGRIESVDGIIKEIQRYNARLVEITGGEPLLQDGVHTLIHELIDRRYTVLLETNGSIALDKVDSRVFKIMDIKCPSSGMSNKMDFNNIRYMDKKDEIKFVIGDREDYDWAKEIVKRYRLTEITQVLLSPVHQALEPMVLANWILEDGLPVRMQIQLHKYIWGSEVKGV